MRVNLKILLLLGAPLWLKASLTYKYLVGGTAGNRHLVRGESASGAMCDQ